MSNFGRHLFIIYIDNNLRDKLYNFLKKNKIQTNLHYIPIYRQPFYKEFGFDINSFPNSEDYYSSAISIPMYPELGEDQLYYIVDNIKELIT